MHSFYTLIPCTKENATCLLVLHQHLKIRVYIYIFVSKSARDKLRTSSKEYVCM